MLRLGNARSNQDFLALLASSFAFYLVLRESTSYSLIVVLYTLSAQPLSIFGPVI